MAHGSKRWIHDWRGRRKRSRDRTQKDWLAELHREDRRKPPNCPQCKHLKKTLRPLWYTRSWLERIEHEAAGHVVLYVNHRGVPVTGWKTWTWIQEVWKYERIAAEDADRYPRGDLQPHYGWLPRQCHACERKWQTYWYGRHDGTPGRGLGGAPAYFRRDLEAKRRAQYKHLMQRAQYQLELYDIVPTSYRRDARWLWW